MVLNQVSLAQDSELGPIVIVLPKVPVVLDDKPAAISIIDQHSIQYASQQLGLDESLGAIPGLFALNRYNFAQDLRLSIRGYGARSNFGIRGIKIFVDGIPETLPDGQGSIDGIDLGAASQITVVRSPSSSLYGNASGGAILIDSERGTPVPFGEYFASLGEYGYAKQQIKTGGETDQVNYLFNLSNTGIDGYRDQSEFRNTQFSARIENFISQTSSLSTTLSVTDQPIAEDPGGLTLSEAEDAPSEARSRNVEFDTGESLTQSRLGILFKTRPGTEQLLETRAYYTDRQFNNRLPFQDGGRVKLSRNFYGAGITYTMDTDWWNKPARFQLGMDYDRQDDHRRRFENLLGMEGDQTFKQDERVISKGLFIQNKLQWGDTEDINFGLRFDEVEFDVDDQFLTDGDDSGAIKFEQLSPTVGLNSRYNAFTNLYANLSSSFETPTTTEFANPGGGGFNQALDVQKSMSLEVGLKALKPGYRLEIALFHIDIRDELTPFELPSQPGRTFFENAGKSKRTGLEISFSKQFTEHFQSTLAYTHSDFNFDRFTDANGNVFDNNQIPGIPKEHLYLDFVWQRDPNLHTHWDITYIGPLYADNANQTEIDSSIVSNFKIAHETQFHDWKLVAFLGVNNLFDETYNNNIRINAFGDRFYEPAPERHAYLGITLRAHPFQ
ncbi:MAG: TonB-dependent receptor [Pseudomonadota bacterium]